MKDDPRLIRICKACLGEFYRWQISTDKDDQWCVGLCGDCYDSCLQSTDEFGNLLPNSAFQAMEDANE